MFILISSAQTVLNARLAARISGGTSGTMRSGRSSCCRFRRRFTAAIIFKTSLECWNLMTTARGRSFPGTPKPRWARSMDIVWTGSCRSLGINSSKNASGSLPSVDSFRFNSLMFFRLDSFV